MKTLLVRFVIFFLIMGMAGTSLAGPRIKGETVTYTAQGGVMKGYLAYDENIKGPRPGVLVVPEWWGLNDYARRRARMLAELGYTALAVDMYGNGRVATNPTEAQKLSSELMRDFAVAEARFLTAREFLRQQPMVDAGEIAAIGYCFGGGVVLNMAAEGTDLRGVVSFHGTLNLVKPAVPGTIKAKILVLTGAADQLVPPDQVAAFWKAMVAAEADFRIVTYPGAMHSFTNPDADRIAKQFTMPVGYNAAADQKSWEEMKSFLATIFTPQVNMSDVNKNTGSDNYRSDWEQFNQEQRDTYNDRLYR
jgi:dienelactone hydrolase